MITGGTALPKFPKFREKQLEACSKNNAPPDVAPGAEGTLG
jgi:hypothetical protein